MNKRPAGQPAGLFVPGAGSTIGFAAPHGARSADTRSQPWPDAMPACAQGEWLLATHCQRLRARRAVVSHRVGPGPPWPRHSPRYTIQGALAGHTRQHRGVQVSRSGIQRAIQQPERVLSARWARAHPMSTANPARDRPSRSHARVAAVARLACRSATSVSRSERVKKPRHRSEGVSGRSWQSAVREFNEVRRGSDRGIRGARCRHGAQRRPQ